MKSADPRDFGLNRLQCARLQERLQAGERLRWAGAPTQLGVQWGLLLWCVYFSLGIAAFVCWRAWLEETPGLFLMAAFFVLLGLGLLVSVVLLYVEWKVNSNLMGETYDNVFASHENLPCALEAFCLFVLAMRCEGWLKGKAKIKAGFQYPP